MKSTQPTLTVVSRRNITSTAGTMLLRIGRDFEGDATTLLAIIQSMFPDVERYAVRLFKREGNIIRNWEMWSIHHRNFYSEPGSILLALRAGWIELAIIQEDRAAPRLRVVHNAS